MNIPIIVSYIYRDSKGKKFARDMSNFSNMNSTWDDSENPVPTMAELISNEAVAYEWSKKNTPSRSIDDHLSKFGYHAIGLLNLFDIENKMIAANMVIPEKAMAVRSWLNNVQISAAKGQALSDAPYSYSEILQEILPYIETLEDAK